jgi:hypothetical protein
MYIEQLMEWELQRKKQVLGANLPKWHFLRTINPTWSDLGSNPSHHDKKSASDRLSYEHKET